VCLPFRVSLFMELMGCGIWDLGFGVLGNQDGLDYFVWLGCFIAVN